MKRFSLTRRLIAAVIVSQVLLAIGMVIVGSYYTRYHLLSAFDVNLEGRALTVGSLAYYPKRGGGIGFDDSRIPPSPHDIHKDFYLVRSESGGFERHSEGFTDELLRSIPMHARYWTFESQGEPYRAVILHDVPIPGAERSADPSIPKLMVVYAAPTMDISQRIGGLAAVFAFACLVLLVPTLILAVWSIRRTLNPLALLALEARSISVQNWSFRPPDQAKAATELAPLIAAIDTVLEGLERAFTRQREFLGDAAHELKTSLAILKSSWQSLLSKPRSADEYRIGLARMTEDSDRLEDLLNRMLRLARVEQWAADGKPRDLDVIDLASTCEMAVARLAQFAASRHVKIECNALESVLMEADPAELELIWINLLENSIHASPEDATVSISLSRRENFAYVCVADCGYGIPESDIPHLFERFKRGDPSRSRSTGGFGLGLAIANSVVVAYKGIISAESVLGQGTRMLVQLPIDPASQPSDAGARNTISKHTV